MDNVILYTGKIWPRFIFALFALRLVGEFKTERIESDVKDYVRKLKSRRIQDWVKVSYLYISKKGWVNSKLYTVNMNKEKSSIVATVNWFLFVMYQFSPFSSVPSMTNLRTDEYKYH